MIEQVSRRHCLRALTGLLGAVAFPILAKELPPVFSDVSFVEKKPKDGWTHIQIMRTDNQMKYYLDGKEVTKAEMQRLNHRFTVLYTGHYCQPYAIPLRPQA